jgi:hypothetical protein
MSRRVVIALCALTGVAYAEDPPMPPETTSGTTPAEPGSTAAPADTTTTAPAATSTTGPDSGTGTALVDTGGRQAPADMSDQAIAPMVGVAAGGRTTPGGLVIAGHYYYKLTDQDWADSSASFTFGSAAADCFRDRMDDVLCDHDLADGYAGRITFAVRRFLPGVASDTFWPFARLGVGAGLVRFSDDDVTGITFYGVAGVGLRASVNENVSITGQADLDLGLGQFSGGVGGEPQLGVNITAGAEFKL